MNFFRKLFAPKVVANRRRIPGELAHHYLMMALRGRFDKDYHFNNTKRFVAITTRQMVQAASDKAFQKRIELAWECEDAARGVVNALQLMGRAEGCSHACGTLVALDARDETPDSKQDRHVWVWCIIEDGEGTSKVALFDATAGDWSDLDDVSHIKFTDC